MPEQSTVENILRTAQAINSFISNNKNIALVKKASDIINKHLPETLKRNACISNALEIDGENKTVRNTEEKNFCFSTLSFGQGSVSDELRKAVSVICDWKEARNTKKFKGSANDHKNLIALFILETVRALANDKILDSKEGIQILTGLTNAIQEITLDDSLVESINPHKSRNLKRALLKAKNHINKARELAECELYDHASVQYLERILKANKSLLNELPEYLLCMFAQNNVPTGVINYETLNPEDWQSLNNTLLQGIVHSIFGRQPSSETITHESTSKLWAATPELQRFIQSLTSCPNLSATQPFVIKDPIFIFIENLRSITLVNPTLMSGTSAKFVYNQPDAKQENPIPLHSQITSGIASELISGDSGVKAFTHLIEILKLVCVMDKLLSVQKSLRDYAKKFGDYGVYIKARDTLAKLLLATTEILTALKKKISELNTMVNTIREEISATADVTAARRENIRKGNNHLENLKNHVNKCEEVVGFLQTQLQMWTSKAPAEMQLKLETEKLSSELCEVREVLSSVGINVDLSAIAPPNILPRPRTQSLTLSQQTSKEKAADLRAKTWHSKTTIHFDPVTGEEFKSEAEFFTFLKTERAKTTCEFKHAAPLAIMEEKHTTTVKKSEQRTLPLLFAYHPNAKDRKDKVNALFHNTNIQKAHFNALANKILAFAYDEQKNHLLATYLQNEENFFALLTKKSNNQDIDQHQNTLQLTIHSLQKIDAILALHNPQTFGFDNLQQIETREFVIESRIAIANRLLALSQSYLDKSQSVSTLKQTGEFVTVLNKLHSWFEQQKFSSFRQLWWTLFPSKNMELQNKLVSCQSKLQDILGQLRQRNYPTTVGISQTSSQPANPIINSNHNSPTIAEIKAEKDVIPIISSSTILNTIAPSEEKPAAITTLAAKPTEAQAVSQVKQNVILADGINFLAPPIFNNSLSIEINRQTLIDYINNIKSPLRLKELDYLAIARRDHHYKIANPIQEKIYHEVIKPAAVFAKQIHLLEQKMPEEQRTFAAYLDGDIRGAALYELDLAKNNKLNNECPPDGNLDCEHAKYLIRTFATRAQNSVWDTTVKDYTKPGLNNNSHAGFFDRDGLVFIPPTQKSTVQTALLPTAEGTQQHNKLNV